MTTQFPVLDTALAVLAGTACLSALVCPATPYLAEPLRPLAVGLSGAWTAWRLWRLDHALQERHAWRQAAAWMLTPSALARHARHLGTGLLIGQGFRWDAVHTQTLETVLRTEKRLPVDQAPRGRGGVPALHAVGRKSLEPVALSFADLGGHTEVLGTTGTGKSTALVVLIRTAIETQIAREQGPVIIFEPKGGRDMLLHAADAADRADRPFALFTTTLPERSVTINPVGTCTSATEVAMRIQALMPSSGGQTTKPFFEQAPLTLIQMIAHGFRILQWPCTLETLQQYATFRQHTQHLLDTLLTFLAVPPARHLRERLKLYQQHRADPLVDGLAKYCLQDPDHFDEIMSNLQPAFRGLVTPPLGRLFVPQPDSLVWDRIVQEKTVVYFSLAALLHGDNANRIGRIILQDLIGYFGQRLAYATDLQTLAPITVFLDDVRLLYYPGFATALAMSREAGARFILAQQSYADAESTLGKATAQVVLDNMNNHLYFRLGSTETAQAISKGLDEALITQPETGVGLHYAGQGGVSGHAQRRQSTRVGALIRPTWLKALPKGDFFALIRGEVWKGQTPLVEPVSAVRRDELGLRDIWTALPNPEEIRDADATILDEHDWALDAEPAADSLSIYGHESG